MLFARGPSGRKDRIPESSEARSLAPSRARACRPLSLTFCPERGVETREGTAIAASGLVGRTRDDPLAAVTATAKTVCSLCRSPPSDSKEHLLSENALSPVRPSVRPSSVHSFVRFLSHSSPSFVLLQRAAIMREELMAKTHRRRQGRERTGERRTEGGRERGSRRKKQS